MSKDIKDKPKKTSNIFWFDKVIMLAAFLLICGLAVSGVEGFVRATYPMNYVLSTGLVGFLCYALLSPLLRK